MAGKLLGLPMTWFAVAALLVTARSTCEYVTIAETGLPVGPRSQQTPL